MPRPLPLAPRPLPGEALSGWGARVASRYEVGANDLCRHLLGGRDFDMARVERLDHRADPELIGLLAAAARIDPARLRAMRAAVDDGTASCWHRMDTAWCPECIRGDVARGPETYARAAWRLGCTVVCPDHEVLLQDACQRCWKAARCHFQPAKGRLRLDCSFSRDLPCDLDQPTEGLQIGSTGTFHVRITLELVALVSELQRDLQAALLGAPPQRSWGLVRSGSSLPTIVRCMVSRIALSKNIPFEQRTELVRVPGDMRATTLWYEPITPAALPPRFAFGAMAVIAAVLDSLEVPGRASHTWEQDGVTPVMDATSFTAWLDDNAQHRRRA